MIAIIVLVIIVVLIIYVISTQRNFIKLDELCENALSQIGVQQQSRWDALTQIAKAAKGYAGHERETLSQVIGARGTVSPNNAADVEKDDNLFAEAMSRVNLLVEAYPDLKADSLYQQAMRAIETYEENVRTSRMVYNDTITKWNRMVKQIPSSLVASIFGFEERQYLETDPSKAAMPDLEF